MKAPDEGALDFLDDGLLHALNPFSVPDWMFGGFLVVLLLLFLIGGAGIQLSQGQARDDECKDRLKRLGQPADTGNTQTHHLPNPLPED